MANANADPTYPLVLVDEAGAVVEVLLQSRKGLSKSIEHGTLWVVHPETGRLLPDGRPVRSIADRGSWFHAVTTAADTPATGDATESSSVPAADSDRSAEGEIGAVLARLADVVAKRKQAMPEGSYTTHLFAGGGEKIRKKTGEEAIELILTHERSELVHESADLLYHLLVLLEHESISLGEIAAELRGRE